MRLLLAEDDTMIGEAVRAGLRRQGFAVDWVRDGVAAEQALLGEAYDACLLDLGLPRKAGLDVLRRLRERGSMLPVVVLTARDAITDRVDGLDAGADDYVVKPFDLAELAARIRAVTRRKGGRAQRSSSTATSRSTRQLVRFGATANWWRCRRASSRCCRHCSSIPDGSCRARNWKSGSTAGARKSRATWSRCTCTRCVANSVPISSATSAASATASPRRAP